VSCPSLTTHSELDDEAIRDAGLTQTTIRFSVGDEDPQDLIHHLKSSARMTIDRDIPGFSERFLSDEDTGSLIRACYLETHSDYIDARLAGNDA
jgi:hypothetical protein